MGALSATAGVAAVLRRKRSAGLDLRDLTGKTAVVTGAGSGIGRSLATLLGRRGAFVHVADLDGASAAAVTQQVRAAGGQALAHTVDVSDAEAVARLAEDVFQRGPVDLLFNNAGIGHAGDVADTPLADWRRLIDVNLMGVVHGLHAFLPRMLAQDRAARIVNTASMAGFVPVPGLAAYSATKAAVVGLSDALDMELAGTQVRVSALCPGVIDTAIVSTSTLRGAWAGRQARAVDLYAKRGTSPDIVAKQALAGAARGRTVIATPRYQVVPHWLLKRMLPPAGRAVSLAILRFASKEG
ncbi:MAG TPA: SDR family NAD(P)-dependent oxidoreductase [Mycobacteriales bacterium]|nr:SDR family NAD(P)-dependent oxidoreductase [Mycobacteriales bacterium]